MLTYPQTCVGLNKLQKLHESDAPKNIASTILLQIISEFKFVRTARYV